MEALHNGTSSVSTKYTYVSQRVLNGPVFFLYLQIVYITKVAEYLLEFRLFHLGFIGCLSCVDTFRKFSYKTS